MDRLKLIGVLTIMMLFVTMFGCSSPEKAWQEAGRENTKEAYRDFLKKFPSSEFTEEAWKRIDDIKWEKAVATNTIEAYQAYLSSVPEGSHKAAAEEAMDSRRWEKARQANTADAYQEFLETNHSSTFAEEAQTAWRLLYTVTEATELIFDKRVQARGNMTFTGTGGVCSQFKYKGEIETIGSVKIPRRQASEFVMCFVPGVKHKYVGRICLPALGESARVSVRFDGAVKIEGGLWYFDGPISINGELSYTPKQGSRFFEITSQTSGGLVLELTRDGYSHISGAGKIVTPKGQQFLF